MYIMGEGVNSEEVLVQGVPGLEIEEERSGIHEDE